MHLCENYYGFSGFYETQRNCHCVNPLCLISLQELEEKAEEDICPELQQKKDDRKHIREEKARLARLAAIQVNTCFMYLNVHVTYVAFIDALIASSIIGIWVARCRQ